MDYLPIVVMLVFVLAGGIIAVFADELGRRIGKRRLTLHRKIRPKTSARILAFTSGVLITLVTMALIGLASSEMRTLLLHGRRLIEDQVAQIAALKSETERLGKEKDGLTQRNATLAGQKYTLETHLTSARRRLDEETAKLAKVDRRLAEVRAREAKLETRMAALNRDLEAKTREIGARNAELIRRKAEIAGLKNEYTKLKDSWAYLKNDRDEIMRSRDDLAKDILALNAEIADKEKQLASNRTAIDEYRTTLSSLEQQVESKKTELAQLQEDANRVLSSLAQSNVEHTRQRPLIFSVGEEILRIPIDRQLSKEQARQKLESALMTAKKRAEERGASNANDIDRADLHDFTDAKGQKVSVEAQKDKLAIELAGATNDEVLIVYSRLNAFADEGVLVALKHQPNPTVYKPGQVLAEVRVDGRQDRAKILDSLNGLGVKIRARALGDGMIPKGDNSFGSATSEDILDLYNQIRASAGSVRVQAIAKYETRAADPLLLSFVVK